MLISQYPLIAGANAGKAIRCHPTIYPIYEELSKAAARGSHWARRVDQELKALSHGSLSKCSSQCKPKGLGIRNHLLSLPGVQFLLEHYSNGQYVLSDIRFSQGSSVEAAKRALANESSTNVATLGATSLSSNGITFLKNIESLRTTPYDDQTGEAIDSWVEGATIGYGHLIPKAEWAIYKGGITEAQADTLFKGDIAPFVNGVNQHITTPLNNHQFDALVILAFNIGIHAFSESSVVKIINDPEAKTTYPSLEEAWKAWKKSQGKVNQGLINRRKAEWTIYTQGVYQTW